MMRMPNTAFTKVRGDGDYVQFSRFLKEVYQNLSAVCTTYSAPNDGHLCLGMNDVKYFVCTGVHYVVPLDPGIYNITIWAIVSHVTISRHKAEHNEDRCAFRTNKTDEFNIKNQIKQAIPPSLIIEIEDEKQGLIISTSSTSLTTFSNDVVKSTTTSMKKTMQGSENPLTPHW